MSAIWAFQLQCGGYKDTVTVDSPEISLRDLRVKALSFVMEKFPGHGLGDALSEHLTGVEAAGRSLPDQDIESEVDRLFRGNYEDIRARR